MYTKFKDMTNKATVFKFNHAKYVNYYIVQIKIRKNKNPTIVQKVHHENINIKIYKTIFATTL